MEGTVYGDASVAMGIVNGTGLGKARHIGTSIFRIRQAVAERRFTFNKVLGENDPADVYTKYLDVSASNNPRGNVKLQFCNEKFKGSS